MQIHIRSSKWIDKGVNQPLCLVDILVIGCCFVTVIVYIDILPAAVSLLSIVSSVTFSPRCHFRYSAMLNISIRLSDSLGIIAISGEIYIVPWASTCQQICMEDKKGGRTVTRTESPCPRGPASFKLPQNAKWPVFLTVQMVEKWPQA